jgi:hypothetical protein
VSLYHLTVRRVISVIRLPFPISRYPPLAEKNRWHRLSAKARVHPHREGIPWDHARDIGRAPHASN